MSTEHSAVSKRRGSKKDGMANNGNGVKLIYYVLSLVLTACVSVATIVVFYYKNKIETEARITELEKKQTADMAELGRRFDVLAANVGWLGDSMESVAKREIPQAIKGAFKDHEYNMHPKQASSAGSPTEIAVEIELPKKPKGTR